MGKEAGVDLKGVGAGGCIWPKYIVWNSERIKILFKKKQKNNNELFKLCRSIQVWGSRGERW